MDIYFIEKIRRTKDYPILDFIYEARSYIARLKNSEDLRESLTKEIIDFLLPMSTFGYKYYEDHKEEIHKDISLRTVTTICNDKKFMDNVDLEDKTVTVLAHLFNDMVNSTRNLYKCYDCGTNARAMFLKLIKARRGKLCLTDAEVDRMNRQYSIDKDPKRSINSFREFAKEVENDTVFIFSIGLRQSGHVWVIEKRIITDEFGQKTPRYHHYQSCLNSHTVLDFIQHKDYANNPHQSLCADDPEAGGDPDKGIDKFCNELIFIMTQTEDWTPDVNLRFAKLFAYLPYAPVVAPENSICWTYVTYKNLDSIDSCHKLNDNINQQIDQIVNKLRKVQNIQQNVN